MNNHPTLAPAAAITGTPVAGADRAAALVKHLGEFAVRGAARYRHYFQHFSKGYCHDEWELIELSNGAFYLRPQAAAQTIVLHVAASGFHGELSLDAAGIVATLHMLNWLASSDPENAGVRGRLFALRKFALALPEEPKIRAAID